MCEGLRKFGEEKENEGRREGLKDGLIEGENKAFVEDVENVAESFHISIQEACEKLKRSYETYLKIKETL